MKEWISRIVFAAITIAATVGINAYTNGKPEMPPPHIQKLIDSVGDSDCWDRKADALFFITPGISLVKKSGSVKIVPGVTYASVYTRRVGKQGEYISDREWVLYGGLSYADAVLINKAAHNTIRDIEMEELSQ